MVSDVVKGDKQVQKNKGRYEFGIGAAAPIEFSVACFNWNDAWVACLFGMGATSLRSRVFIPPPVASLKRLSTNSSQGRVLLERYELMKGDLKKSYS
jgi:hypothetical protein